MRIQALRPRVDFETASRRLFRPRWRRLFGGRQRGTLAEFFVPYFVFTVEADVEGQQEQSFWAVDGRGGNIDATVLKRLPKASELVELETTNCLDFKIDEARARAILHERFRRSYQAGRGPLALQQLSLTVAVPAQRLHWPFWVAAIEQHSQPHFEALDAISGQAQDRKWIDAMLGGRRIRSQLSLHRSH